MTPNPYLANPSFAPSLLSPQVFPKPEYNFESYILDLIKLHMEYAIRLPEYFDESIQYEILYSQDYDDLEIRGLEWLECFIEERVDENTEAFDASEHEKGIVTEVNIVKP
jgi:hypothetical protein